MIANSTYYFIPYSCQPRHTKVTIPFNLARHLRTIISKEQTLQKCMRELKYFLMKQKYPENIVDFDIHKAMALDKEILRTVKMNQDECIISYVSTYNPQNPEMFRVIINNLPILEEDEKMRGILSKFKPIKSKGQPYNLKRLPPMTSTQ